MNETFHQTNADRRELITFRIGEQEFAVDIMSVREIRGWSPATPLPQTPEYMRGVINLRGAVLPIMDLAARLGLTITPDAIQPPPDIACDRVRSFVKGLISFEGRMISEIALEHLLPELEALAA